MEENVCSSSSSTPHSMSFGNTPKRTIFSQRVSTPLQRIKEQESPEKESQVKTPVSINPFEVKPDSLYFPSCSPSVFATFARNKTNNGKFRWSIDHVSVLYPADIDETSIQDVWVDPDQEQQAQKAIDAFFSQNSIVPSPWSSDSKNRREFKLRSINGESSENAVATQTTLTIPPNIDILALLGNGNEFVYKEEDSSSSSGSSLRDLDVMSTSSLRRKLFANDDDCKTPRLERKDLNLAKQWSTPTINARSLQSTPSDLLSSSPITPPNCSDSCVIRSSPQMSPIAGPSSQRSFRMRSFIERLDEESSSQPTDRPLSHHPASEISMSFSMDSQDIRASHFSTSERQDTGYVTGSLSSQNMTSSDTSTVFQTRFVPSSGLLEEGGFSNMSCSNGNSVCMASPPPKFKDEGRSNKWAITPSHCSTPTFHL